MIESRVRVEQALGSPDHRADEDSLRSRIGHSVARSYDPAAAARQETVTFVKHIETADYRYGPDRAIDPAAQ